MEWGKGLIQGLEEWIFFFFFLSPFLPHAEEDGRQQQLARGKAGRREKENEEGQQSSVWLGQLIISQVDVFCQLEHLLPMILNYG